MTKTFLFILLSINLFVESYAFNINYKLPIYQNINIDSLYEFVSIKNYHLQKNFKEKYHHLSNIISFYNNYNITISKSWLLNSKISQKYRESLMEISTGYNFKNDRYFNNLLLQAGYQKIKEQQENKDHEAKLPDSANHTCASHLVLQLKLFSLG